MEAVVFCGIQGSGKTTFYRERFSRTHVRISLDELRTRARERALVEACVEAGRPFVVDNTNPTAPERAVYVRPAAHAGFRLVTCFFPVTPREAIARNERRAGKERIPIPGLLATHRRLEVPSTEEGFDELFRVAIRADGRFAVAPLIGAARAAV